MLFGLCLVSRLGPFGKANPRAHHPDRPRPIGLRALWLVDPKSLVFTISDCFLGVLEDETFSKYQALGERSTSLDTVADLSMHLMCLFMPCSI